MFVARESEEDDVSRERPFSLYTQLEVGMVWPSSALFVRLLSVRSRLLGSRGRTGYAKGRVSVGWGEGRPHRSEWAGYRSGRGEAGLKVGDCPWDSKCRKPNTSEAKTSRHS